MWKAIRIVILLIVLATVANEAYRAQKDATDWKHTLHITIYPINADGMAVTQTYIDNLKEDTYADIERFLTEEVKRHGMPTLYPVRVLLQRGAEGRPPTAPLSEEMIDAIFWSLHLRWWAWRQPKSKPAGQIRLFVQYWDPKNPRVPSSHGLKEGLIGVVNAYASRAQNGENNVVIAHELLHTLGATDKYDPDTQLPLHPAGYAEPDRKPRLPQHLCEVMAGRIPISTTKANMPHRLNECLIGPETAQEIGLTAAAAAAAAEPKK